MLWHDEEHLGISSIHLPSLLNDFLASPVFLFIILTFESDSRLLQVILDLLKQMHSIAS